MTLELPHDPSRVLVIYEIAGDVYVLHLYRDGAGVYLRDEGARLIERASGRDPLDVLADAIEDARG